MIIDPYNFRSVKIIHKKFIADETISIVVEKPDYYDFLAGQYAIIRAAVPASMRQYSFASSPDSDYLEFLIRRQPGGVVSNWFCDHSSAGQTIEISAALGGFTRRDDEPSLFIAGGIGVAPFLSMLRSSPGNTGLYYSERLESRQCYNEELSALLGNDYHPIISAGSGRMSAASIKNITDSKSIYICGSKLFVDDIESQIQALKNGQADIHRELFTLQ